ncbi:uncharacterized protein LOC134210516 [Armigeres subalbatus]|uniref:uncharacterized protein LOC134210516 n=1 Tax=Armigeres subalbatus TaxID=124917 RepID=UPI002ED252BE
MEPVLFNQDIQLGSERVLGITWDPETDVFAFPIMHRESVRANVYDSKRPARCNEKHHTLLHPSSPNGRATQPQAKPPIRTQQYTSNTDDESVIPALVSVLTPFASNTSSATQLPSTSNALAAVSSSKATYSTVLLSTTVVHGPSGKSTFVRTLLDSGSESNFITERIVQLLGLHRQKRVAVIAGMGGSTVNSHQCTVATFCSVDSTYSNTLEFSILSKITNDLPGRILDVSKWNIPSTVVLADPDFATPQRIDMVIGAQLFFSLLREGQLPVGTGSPTSHPVLQRTVLGWVISGSVSTAVQARCIKPVALLCTTEELDRQLSRFWEVESCPTSRGLSKEEAACEQYFTETTTHDESGRFIVRLPKKEGILSHLGDSKAGALRRLIKNLDLKAQSVARHHPFYLPHHAVLKPSSTTTKCRVVFDGSSKSSTGISLNDCLMVGPTVQDTLYSIVVRFRINEIALVADIAKMYRQIWVHPDDRHLQRIFWKGETDFVVRPYELTTVTYGTSSAPYLATRCLQQLSYEHSKDDGDIPSKIGKDFYVDDFLSGSDTDKRSIVEVDDIQGSVSTLGLLWHPESDTFRFKVHEFSKNLPITKRIVVSEMSKLFDPLGILGPVVIRAKVFVQQLWKTNLDWDEPLPIALNGEWESYRLGLAALERFSISRLVKAPGAGASIQLHGFCDASQHAYGACIYIRSTGMDGAIVCRLLTAKSRVAPIQTLSIPRLELSSAVLLSQLYQNVVCSLNMTPEAYFWSDSSITLHWLHNPPANYNTFVANRVAEVQRMTEGGTWNHVAGLENPADLISRGIDPCELANVAFWWKGPPWLSSDALVWSSMFLIPESQEVLPEILEVKPTTLAAVARSVKVPDHTLICRYSSLTRLIRIAAYNRRFVRPCRSNIAGAGLQVTPFLTADELQQALIGLVKIASAMKSLVLVHPQASDTST